MKMEEFTDKNHRIINYLRISITDRCNLRCIYCMPEERIRFAPHSEILTYEEMLHLVGLSVQSGIRKVRLTGGEPLVRKGFINFLGRLCKTEGLNEITLTTNGVLLKEFAAEIKACGICRINISLDSLKAERFFQITGRDYFDRVWEGIQEAERLEGDSWNIPEEATVAQFLEMLNLPEKEVKILLINGRHGDKERILKEADVFHVFPPMMGG